MAKRGSRSSSYTNSRRNVLPSRNTTRQRVLPIIKLSTLPALYLSPYQTPFVRIKKPARKPNAFTDRRQFNPTRRTESPPAILRRSSQLVVPRHRNPFNPLPSQLAFREPDRVAICRRRRARKRALFAIRVAGKRGTGSGRSKRRNIYSSVSCKG